jgi:hypothetical protein
MGPVQVVCLSGQTFDFVVSFSDPTIVLMAYISQDLGVSMKGMKLFYGKKKLHKMKRLDVAGVGANSIIQMNQNMAGGGGQAKRIRHEAASIPTLMTKPATLDSDCDEVVAALSMENIDIKSWLRSLSSCRLQVQTAKFVMYT